MPIVNTFIQPKCEIQKIQKKYCWITLFIYRSHSKFQFFGRAHLNPCGGGYSVVSHCYKSQVELSVWVCVCMCVCVCYSWFDPRTAQMMGPGPSSEVLAHLTYLTTARTPHVAVYMWVIHARTRYSVHPSHQKTKFTRAQYTDLWTGYQATALLLTATRAFSYNRHWVYCLRTPPTTQL